MFLSKVSVMYCFMKPIKMCMWIFQAGGILVVGFWWSMGVLDFLTLNWRVFMTPDTFNLSFLTLSLWFYALAGFHSTSAYWNSHKSLYLLIWDFLLSQIDIRTTTTWSNVWVVLPKSSWYEFLIGFLIWTPASKYLHLTTFSNIYVILSMFLYL